MRYVVEFIDTGFQTVSFGNRIRSGNVKDYLLPWVCGVGFIGDCSYEDEPSKNPLYKHWQGLFDRCYNKDCKQYRPNGSVDTHWHCFMNFVKDAEYMLGYDEMKKIKK